MKTKVCNFSFLSDNFMKKIFKGHLPVMFNKFIKQILIFLKISFK